MQVLEYKMDAGPDGMVTPYWVEDGGYFSDPDNHTMVGKCRDNQEWKIPETVTKLTLTQLQDRLVDIHSRYPYAHFTTMSDLTEAEVRQMATDWYNA